MIKIIQLTIIIALLSSCGSWWPGDDKSDEGDKAGVESIAAEPAQDTDITRIQDTARSREDMAGLGLTMASLPQGGFVTLDQIKTSWFNPLRPRSCSGFEPSPGFTEAISALGGIKWGYGIRYEQNERIPRVYADIHVYDNQGDNDNADKLSSAAGNQEDFAREGAPLPEIARADLIGRHENRVIFLSQRFGLFFVTVPEQGVPQVSCAVMVPGHAKNFYVHGGQLFLIVNSAGNDQGGVIRYELGDNDLRYSSHRLLASHQIIDSRRFDDSLALYTSVKIAPPASAVDGDATPGFGLDSAVEPGFGRPSTSLPPQPQAYALTVIDMNSDDLAVAFEEQFTEEAESMDLANLTADPALIGQAIDKTTSYNNFLSASGRFIVISKTVNQRIVTELRDQSHTATYCVKSHREERRRTYCRAVWETIANPQFDPDFSCTDAATFDSCVANNKSKFVRSYSHYRGRECKEHRYEISVCDGYETKTWTTTHPVTEDRGYTEMIVYEFDDGEFRRLGGPDQAPIRQEGRVLEHKSFQFRGDYLYVASTRGLSAPRWRNTFNDGRVLTKVQAYLVQDGIFAPVGQLDELGEGMYVSAVLFQEEMLYLEMNRVQYPYYPYGGNKGGPLYGISLETPHLPTFAGEARSNGYSTQLIAVGDRLLGVGQTPDERRTHRSHARTALYDVNAATGIRELDQLEYMSSYRSSTNGVGTDDQIFHLDSANKRLIMPVVGRGVVDNEYDGFICNEHLWMTQNQVTITQIDGDRLVAEGAFNTNQKVQRSLALNDQSILAFSDAAVYHISQASNAWAMNVVQEELITESIYRDPSLPDGMIVARQVLRNGHRLVKLRFVMGTVAEIEANTANVFVDVPENMIACLGDPRRVSFHDDKIVVSFHQVITKDIDDDTRAHIDYRSHLAWHVAAEGFQRLSDEDAKKLSEEQRKNCYLRDPLAAEANETEIAAVLAGLSVDQLACWQADDPVDFVGIRPLL